MKIILSFLYKDQQYIIFEYQTKIFLGKIWNNNLITIEDSDKNVLKEIIIKRIYRRIKKCNTIRYIR